MAAKSRFPCGRAGAGWEGQGWYRELPPTLHIPSGSTAPFTWQSSRAVSRRLASPGEPVKRLRWEPAGYSFHQAALRLLLGHSWGARGGEGGGGGGRGARGRGRRREDCSGTPITSTGGAMQTLLLGRAAGGAKKPGKGTALGRRKIQQDHCAAAGAGTPPVPLRLRTRSGKASQVSAEQKKLCS